MTSRLGTAVWMTAREVLRNRTACVLALVLPLLFYGITLVMMVERIVVFQLASVSAEPDLEVPARSEVLVFMALIAIGFMSAFFGVNLIQKHGRTNHRLVVCGYRPSELVVSKLLVLAGSVVILSIYCIALMSPFFIPRHPTTVFSGLVLVGYVYGCYGLMIGSLWRRELESMFSVILLTNIDVGWLQNPVVYTEAENKTFIHWLPAFWPVQAAMTGAFTDHGIGSAVLGAFTYGTVLLFIAIFVFWRRVRMATSPARRKYVVAAGMFVCILSWCGVAVAQKPSPWRFLKRETDVASASMDRAAHGGRSSVRLTAEKRTAGEVAVLQPLRGSTWQGKRVRLSGFLNATLSAGEAGLVVVVNNGSRYTFYFPSQERLIKDSSGWRSMSVTVDIPADATLVSIGAWIRRGSGSLWLDDVTFEEIARDATKTVEPRRSSPMTRNDLDRVGVLSESAADRPYELDFEGPITAVDAW